MSIPLAAFAGEWTFSWNVGLGLFRQQVIGVFLQLVHQFFGIVGMGLDEGVDRLLGFLAVMSAEQGGEPIAGEEDVARLLHFLEHVESGLDITIALGLPGAVVEQAEQ